MQQQAGVQAVPQGSPAGGLQLKRPDEAPTSPVPTEAQHIDALLREIERQTAETREIFRATAARASSWRPSPSRWSVAGHVAHLCILNAPYLAAMRECAGSARRKGLLSEGPYRHPWFGRWFAGQMEPPPRRRWKTMKGMAPDPEVDGPSVLDTFVRLQGEFSDVVGGARGIDLGRARFSSPFARLMRLSLGTGFAVLLAHNRRHLWLAREVMENESFPRAGSPA